MEIRSLTSDAFRNLAPGRVELHPRLNLVLGRNGQGKTNLLEALALVSGRPSFRTNDLSDAVATGARAAALSARVSREGREETLGLEIAGGVRRHTANGRRATRAVVARLAPAVFLTAEDLTRLTGSPAERRRALDRVAYALEPGHGASLSSYERARASKNRLLSLSRGFDPDELAVYDETLADAGGRIAEARRRATARLAEALPREAARLDSPFHPLTLELTSDLPREGDARALSVELGRVIAAHRSAERRAGRTLVGPHRDDLVLSSTGIPVAARASSGENRTLVLAWTLAELSIVSAAAKETALLAFDDFDSEWDRAVLQAFARALPQDGQVVLTSARPEALSSLPLPEGASFHVRAGVFARATSPSAVAVAC